MSTQPTERHVRVCPTHLVEVEEHGTSLICPRGQHAVSHFKVIDRLKRTVTAEVAVDGDDRRGGLVGEGTKITLARPGAATASAVPAREKKTEAMATAGFEDEAGARLFVRLIRHVKARQTSYVVRWARHEPGKKSPAQTAALASEIYQGKAQAAFDTALAAARKDGWRDRQLASHQVRFAPLPKPGTAKKGR